MENWLLDLIFYAVLVLALAWPIIRVMAVIDLVNRFYRLTNPPKTPKARTPEQIAASKASAAKLTAMTLEYDRTKASKA